MPKTEVSTTEAMPTTAEMLHKAASEISPLLVNDFYGRVMLIYEKGNLVRVEVLQSYKV